MRPNSPRVLFYASIIISADFAVNVYNDLDCFAESDADTIRLLKILHAHAVTAAFSLHLRHVTELINEISEESSSRRRAEFALYISGI